MPFSNAEGKSEISRWIEEISPYTVLDIGPGSGTYGRLIQELPIASPMINGIEAWAPYIEKFDLDKYYNYVIVADVRYVDPAALSGYDLVIVGDVIEHMRTADAKFLLKDLVKKNQNVIVSFPILHLAQEAWEGNTFEVHKDHWTYEGMREFARESGFIIRDADHGDTLAWFWLTYF